MAKKKEKDIIINLEKAYDVYGEKELQEKYNIYIQSWGDYEKNTTVRLELKKGINNSSHEYG